MKSNLFDLTGKECFCCANSKGTDDIQKITPIPLHTLLIYPRIPNTNKSPYLQDPTAPVIEDFYTKDGYFDFSNSFFLSEMLSSEIDNSKRAHLRKYFNYQLGILPEFDRSNFNIILVPDNYDAEKQEKLLRSCSLPRNNTLLLWRSVAICLGAEDELLAAGVKEGDKIAIIDAQSSRTLNISILTMRYDGEKLVPARGSFNRKEKYPVVEAECSDAACLSDDGWEIVDGGREFWEHTWQRDGEFFVPDGDSWAKMTFEKYPGRYSNILPDSLRNEIDFYIVAGDTEIDFLKYLDYTTVIHENAGNNFALRGAGRFSVRNANGLPTYFDECESLYFIVQDLLEEKIIPKELIKGHEFCRGGQEITGVVNRDFVLGRDNDSVSFLMHVGDITNSTHLRELIQKFGRTALDDQPLVLYPSMIPGQGIANVTVEASPLLHDKVELDFLKMSLAYDGRNPKTINYLQENLPRSYPVDFPEAEASENLWDTYCRRDVRLFMESNIPLDSGCFAHTTWPNAGYGRGIDVLKRINVFGTKLGVEYPIRDEEYLHKMFGKIAIQFKNKRDSDYIRLAAWTYRCGIKELQCVVDYVLDKVQKKAAGQSVSVQTQEFTVCANMLAIKEQTVFFHCFNKYVDPIVKQARDNKHQTAISNVDNWIRALLWILIYSNELLKEVSTSDCNKCMYNLYVIWKNYIQHKTKSTQERYVRYVICCMLFLLRRRKYDHDFLREDTTPIFAKIMELKHFIDQQADSLFYSNAKIDLAYAFFEYLENKGRLDIPMGGILNDGN